MIVCVQNERTKHRNTKRASVGRKMKAFRWEEPDKTEDLEEAGGDDGGGSLKPL